MTNKENTTGRYLYAFVKCSRDITFGPLGIEGAMVYTVSDGHIAAIISDLPLSRIRPQRRHIAAHQLVLKQLMQQSTPLPMAFGIIASGIEEIRRILAINRNTLLEQLDHVAGRVEMGLRLGWDVPNIFEYFIAIHPELRVTRDRIFSRHHEPARDDKIELGRIFERILNKDRELHTGKVELILSSCCIEMKRNRPRKESEVMNLACLVPADRLEQFEAGIFQAAKLFDNNFSFDYSGPWAPHNFVETGLKFEV